MANRPAAYRVLAAVVVAVALLATACAPGARTATTRPLVLGGIATDPEHPARGVLALPIDAGPEQPTAVQQAWLALGTVPGAPGAEHDTAERALLDLRLLTQPDGTVAAAWYGMWKYMWPRDAAWASAAYTATGHAPEAVAVLRRLASLQRPDGTWDARYRLDGAPVGDGRQPQLDAVGWVPWAVWFWYVHQDPAAPGTTDALAALWPAVGRAADAAARSLRADGLPKAASDYWEKPAGQTTLGNAAALLSGLRASADLAARTGHTAEAARWTAAAQRLAAAVSSRFGAHGYPRTPSPGSGADAAVAWLAPPFAPADPAVAASVAASRKALTLPNGGVLPGAKWSGDTTAAWTPETASFALAAAAGGDPGEATALVDWLAGHRTAAGSLPEKVDAAGHPASVAPLAWTDAAVLLALAARDGGPGAVPVVPAVPAG